MAESKEIQESYDAFAEQEQKAKERKEEKLINQARGFFKIGQKKPSQAKQAIDLALQSGNVYFLDEHSTPFAQFQVINDQDRKKDHTQVHPIRGRYFKSWLMKKYKYTYDEVLSTNALTQAIQQLEAEALFSSFRYAVHNRCAVYDEKIYYDLCSSDWDVVEISKDGWKVTKKSPVLFRRYAHQKAQVMPEAGGDIKEILNFTTLKTEGDKQLFLVVVVSQFIADIPHPVMVIHGQQGACKSTHFNIVRKIVDPASMKLLTFPKDKRELVQKLAHHWCALFDNVTSISAEQSDMLCRAVTGAGFSKRQLYTDDEDQIYSYRRCIGLNGINIPATKPDLLDRSLLFHVNRLPKQLRKTEKELWKGFAQVKPRILGAIFDILVQAQNEFPKVKLINLPRMADFAIWGEAISRAMGYEPDSFYNIYLENVAKQNREALESHVVGHLILSFMESRDEWEGTATELLEELTKKAEELKINIIDKSARFPKRPNTLRRRLNEIQANLQEEDIVVTPLPRSDKAGTRRLRFSNLLQSTKVQKQQKILSVPPDRQIKHENEKRVSSENREVSSEDTGVSSEDQAQTDDTGETDDKICHFTTSIFSQTERTYHACFKCRKAPCEYTDSSGNYWCEPCKNEHSKIYAGEERIKE